MPCLGAFDCDDSQQLYLFANLWNAYRKELHAIQSQPRRTTPPFGPHPGQRSRDGRKILRALADPVELALLNAPEDDEPLSAHEQAAWDADQRRRQAGARPITHEELLSDLGISEADLR
jgi:uncharacterized protein YjiS (DUF1127 family)